VPTKALERGIVMPRDLETNIDNYPSIKDTLLINRANFERTVAKRGRGKGKRLMKKGGAAGKFAPELMFTNGGKLLYNEKGSMKVFEYGNFPVLETGKPRGGQYRMMLPCDADWTGRDKDQDALEAKKMDEP
jgi:hypothetical protein